MVAQLAFTSAAEPLPARRLAAKTARIFILFFIVCPFVDDSKHEPKTG
jgi:hypothetical protein